MNPEDEDSLRAARGIVYGLILGVLFWTSIIYFWNL